MTRLPVVFAAAGVLLLMSMAAITEASTKTIISTTTFGDENIRTGESCSQQMMDQQMLNHCMMYLMTSPRGRGTRQASRGQEAEEHLEQCCAQLRNIDEGCRCDTIKMMLNQQGCRSQQEMGQMMETAMSLPQVCNLEPQRCQMRAVWV